jgi:hypothetical protein
MATEPVKHVTPGSVVTYTVTYTEAEYQKIGRLTFCSILAFLGSLFGFIWVASGQHLDFTSQLIILGSAAAAWMYIALCTHSRSL